MCGVYVCVCVCARADFLSRFQREEEFGERDL